MSGRSSRQQKRLLNHYIDLHQAMTSTMYISSEHREKSPQSTATVEPGPYCIVL